MKAQSIRIADVFIIGPLMTWGGLKLRANYPEAGGLLAVLGVATAVYNANNYFIRQREIEQTGR